MVKHRTFAFGDDGEVLDGAAQEVASLAGHLNLDKLVLGLDNSKIAIQGATDLAFTEGVGERFEAYGWRLIRVAEGENLDALAKAFQEASKPCGKPALTNCRTIIGLPAPTWQNSHHAHVAPLGEAVIWATMQILGREPDGHSGCRWEPWPSGARAGRGFLLEQ